MISSLMLFMSDDDCKREYVDIGGAVVEYSKNDGRCIVGRIITTDPNFYLDDKFYPGQDITDIVNQR